MRVEVEMTASLYQGQGDYTEVVGQKPKGHLPEKMNLVGRVAALKQGSIGPVMSDLQNMMENERKQHEQGYRNSHGHNDGSEPLGQPSF